MALSLLPWFPFSKRVSRGPPAMGSSRQYRAFSGYVRPEIPKQDPEGPRIEKIQSRGAVLKKVKLSIWNEIFN